MQIEDKHPNIIFILSDDQGYWAAGPYGNNEVRTPNHDRLSKNGVTFDKMYCVSPVCSPARASILTGTIPSFHGVHDWIRQGNSALEKGAKSPVEYLEGMTSYSQVLSEHGYRCGVFGKWHLGNSHVPQQGFIDWLVHPSGSGRYYDSDLINAKGEVERFDGYITDVITDHALKFIEDRRNGDEPYCLSINYTAPHSPWRRDEHPKDIFDRYYNECQFKSVPHLPMHPWQASTAPVGFTVERRRELLSGYYAAVEEMDRNIGRILDTLEKHGEIENTLIVLTSDNGMNMGHHGLYGKGNASFPPNMYETSVRVPGIVSHVGSIEGGRRLDAVVSHYDLMPTILEYVGIGIPTSYTGPGISLLPLLFDEGPIDRRCVYIFSEYGPVHMVRNDEWKYVHRYPYGPHELYNLSTDPDEAHNLVQLNEFVEILNGLRDDLASWYREYSSTLFSGVSLPVTGRGQIEAITPERSANRAFMDDFFFVNGFPESHRSYEN